MNTEPTPLAADAPRPIQHGLLVCWGQFAQELGLLEALQEVPVPQKTVIHSPAAKLLTLFTGLLSGIEHLTDLTHAPAPPYRDPLPPVITSCNNACALLASLLPRRSSCWRRPVPTGSSWREHCMRRAMP